MRKINSLWKQCKNEAEKRKETLNRSIKRRQRERRKKWKRKTAHSPPNLQGKLLQKRQISEYTRRSLPI